jgi:hypothetical protein
VTGRARTALVAGATVLAVAALAYALMRGWSAVTQYDWTLQPGWIAAGIATLSVAYLGAALIYARIVIRLHPPAAPHAKTLERAWAISLIGRYVPGNVLMVAGRMEMGHAVGVPRRVSVATSVYEQVLMIVTSATGGLLYLALYGEVGNSRLVWLLLLVPLMLVVVHPRVLGPVSSAGLKKIGREPLSILLSPGQTAVALGSYACVQGLVGVGAWMFVRAATGPEAQPGFVALGFLLAFTVSMLAFVLPSGLGVREGALALVLSPRLPGGVAVAVAIGLRFAITVFELGFVSVMTAAWRRRRPHYPLAVHDDAG